MTTFNAAEISERLQKSIKEMKIEPSIRSEGTITSLRDGIVQIHGMGDVVYGEKIQFLMGSLGWLLI